MDLTPQELEQRRKQNDVLERQYQESREWHKKKHITEKRLSLSI